MKNQSKLIFLFINFFLLVFTANIFAQTSWKGTINTSWKTAGNWTNGVPTATTDVIIGDANFTGSKQPSITASSYCHDITIGGTKASTLTIGKNFTISGSLNLTGNGTIIQNKSTLTIQGNWLNNGTYTANNKSSLVSFGGVSQLLGGSNATTFRLMKINAGSNVTLGANISSTGSSNYIYVYGTLNPGQSPTYAVTGTGAFTVFSTGTIKVNAATLTANYAPAVTLNTGSTVDYASTTVNQTIYATSYSTLKISGSTIKSLAANLPSLSSSTSADGNIYVVSGTMDLATYTANRGTTITGGNLSVSNGAFLRIGGTNTLPINFNTVNLSLTSNTEYYGTTQTVATKTYGNLKLSSSSGAAAKSTGSTAFTIAGNLVTEIGAGSSVTFTAGAAITVSGVDSIGASTTFIGGTYAHTMAGNIVNNGTLTGGTSTITMSGAGSNIAGSGAYSFYNLSITASNISAAGTNITIAGNLTTAGSGTFLQNIGNTITMTGAGKSITGAGILFNNLTVSGTVTTTSTFIITGNLSLPGSLTASTGNISFTGTAKTISGVGTGAFYGLLIPGTVSVSSNFSVSNALDVSGSFTATAGTATFTGSATLNGTVNLNNVVLNATSLLLSTNSILGIANTFTITAGTLNVTTAIPNTVSFNGSGAQNIPSTTFDRLTLTNSGTKTAVGAITAKGVFTIDAGVTFNAASYTHTLQSHLVNTGSFTAGTSTMSFTGTKDVNISGSNTFYALTVNKSSAANVVTILNDATAPTVNMTSGVLQTGINTLTITGTRTGNGYIYGKIKRQHAFTTATAYAFEGPSNTITFTSVSGVTSITVNVSQTNVSDFPYGTAVNRLYDITVPAGTYTATLRLHYEDAELNGNTESSMLLWNYISSTWTNIGKTSNDATANYVEKTGLTNITNRWTFAGLPNVLRWNGLNSIDWNTAANWTVIQGTPGSVPGANDIVQIGQSAITNQPTISTGVSIKNMEFGSVAAATLTMVAGGSLTTAGNINGTWSGNATHTINAGAQNITVNGSMILSDGTSGHAINLSMSGGTVNIRQSLVESGGANVTVSGTGGLYIGESFNYTNGTFTAGSGTVYYDGSQVQVVGGVTYNNLVVSKSNGIARIDNAINVNGNMTVSGGELNFNANATLAGTLTVTSGSTITFNAVTLSIGGDLSNSGNFIPGSGTISFTGTGSQLISLATFNNIVINKPSGNTTFTGSISVYGNFSILSGSINLGNYTANRTSLGGVFAMSAGTSISVSGTNNFPGSYSSYALDATSTATFAGTGVQTVNTLDYGNLTLSNGGSNAKTLVGHINVNGNLTINSGATLNAGAYNLSLGGNWLNTGTFVPSTGAVLLVGVNKTITGATTFNKLTVYGTYVVAGADIIYNGLVTITSGGSYDGGSGVGTVNGDLINSGTLISTGTTNFSGTTVQTIRLLSPIQSNAYGIINFNGTVAPILNSTATPQFATVNINNTGGVSASVPWVVAVAFNVNAGATFNGGVSAHYFYGGFSNSGTVTSDGTFNFLPYTSKTYSLAGTNFTSTGTVVFGGSAAITVNGTPTALNDVVIANTIGVTPTSNWDISRNFTINSNAVFNASSYTYTVGGDIESNGTLNGGTSTFTMNSAAGEISGSPATTFYDFIVAGVVTANVDFNVSHNFTNNNTFDASIGSLVMTGTGPSIIGGTASPFSIAQFDVKKTGAGTVTLAKNVLDVLNIGVISGILDASSYTITEDVSGGAISIYDNATLKIGGNNSLPVFSYYDLDTLSTVEYNGLTQSIASLSAFGANYGNLTISTSGTKTANGSLNIVNNFTLTNGSFVTGSYIDSLGGNWLMTSGALNSTGTTLTLNGINPQNINSTGAFNNLLVNKATAYATLGSNVTMTGTLTFTSGKIVTSSNTLIMSATTPTVSGAGQGTGWVVGKLQKKMATGIISRTFEIGDSTIYSPATVAFTWVLSAGTFTANVTNTDHPDIINSGHNSARSVNRYFTITNTGTTMSGGATITFNWIAGDVDAGANTSSFKVKNYNGSTWNSETVMSPTATSIMADSVSAFGDFAIGEIVNASNWTGAFSTNWTTSGNWSNGVPTASTNITIPGSLSNYPVVNSGTVPVKNITINSGASITLNGATMEVTGSITNAGNIVASNGTFVLGGAAAQTIPAALFQSNVVKNLTINNTAGVTLGGTLGLTGTLTLSNGLFASAGYLTLKSSATTTAIVAPVTSGTISGNVTVERYISNRRSWRLLTLPVAYSNTIYNAWQNGRIYQAGKGTFITGPSPIPAINGLDSSITNNVSMKSFVTATQAFQNITNTKSTTLSGNSSNSSDNIGYFIFIRGDRDPANLSGSSSNATTLSGSGKLQTGPQLFPASSTSGNYTLVGNPYASPIDFNLLTKTNLINRFYVWDPTLNLVGGYVTVDDIATPGVYVTSPASAQTKEIQSGQAFFIMTQSNGPASLGISETSKSTLVNTAVFRPAPSASPVASLKTDLYLFDGGKNATLADGAMVQFRDGFNAGVDLQDAEKFGNVNEAIGMLRNGKTLAIERRPIINANDTLYYKLTKTTQRNYQFVISPENMAKANMTAYLEDSYTKIPTVVSLSEPTKINFSIDANITSQSASRFRIVFKLKKELPVVFKTIAAILQKNDIEVKWAVDNAVEGQHYNVEKSENGIDFSTVKIVAADTSIADYKWLDVNAKIGTNIYRISNISSEGKVIYSETATVTKSNAKSSFVVFPNPVTNNVIGLEMNNIPKGSYNVRLLNMAGQVFLTRKINHLGGSSKDAIKSTKHLSKGIYQLEITDKSNQSITINITVN